MDTDAFIAVNRPQWERLQELVRSRYLDAAGIDELIALYQETSTHLSTVRSTNPDPALIARLSLLVHRARLRITGAQVPLWRNLRRFFWEDLPAALYTARWSTALAATIFLLSTVISGLYFGLDSTARDLVVPEEAQRHLAQREFVAYYFADDATGFAAEVWTNNAWIAVQAVVFGVTGFWPVVMLLQNGLNIGLSAGVMGAYGGLGTFFVFILPHGLLEMTAVIVGAGAGLRTFWAWVRPGPLPRLWSLSQAARALVTVAIGLVPVLLLAGVIEAFVTPSGLPPAVRIGIGVLVWALFLLFMLGRGRQVHRAGITGDLTEEQVGSTVATAA
ncbi:stage II sporulation protein M [Brachybacterium sp. UMB0905]|uniref:stage II sporulation protein M n=1 Tax=Brachybacterium sp. UMB0905 TaxID=2069310 RepID=UPI000C810644|nr:stage II sporulation protein M [Brachybacterium sp. UMB0905]PMC76534.1 stage II sporulation protein M [Brachybacterium sp. UMB0905]